MLKIILIDDEVGFLDLTKTYLKKENEDFEIKTTNSPKKALKLIKERENMIVSFQITKCLK